MSIDKTKRFHEPSGRICRNCGEEIKGGNWLLCRPCQRKLAKNEGVEVAADGEFAFEPVRLSELAYFTGPQGSGPNGGHRHVKK